MQGKPTQLPLQELFWGRHRTHPLLQALPFHTKVCSRRAASGEHTGAPNNTVRQLYLLPLV